MKLIKKIFASKEIKAVILALDEFEYKCNTSIFKLIREVVESSILQYQENFINVIKEQDITPKQKVYSMMEHVVGDYLQSGSTDFYVYRGLLNPCGEELLRIYDMIIDSMKESNCISNEDAIKQKMDIRNCIKNAC